MSLIKEGDLFNILPKEGPTVEEAETLGDIGVEKVAISSAVIENPLLLKKLVSVVGSQSVVVVMDVLEQKNFLSKKKLFNAW